jgi:hypothetical protein
MSFSKNTSIRAICLALFLLTLISPLFWECKKINPDGPPATTLDSTLATPVSYVSIPIHYELSRFEEFLNAKISGRFLTSGLKVRDNKDSVYFELSKSGPIRMKIRGQRLYIEFPVHAEGTYFGKFAGIKFQYKKNPVETDIRLWLEADVILDQDWRITPKIELSKIQWIKDPVVKIGPVKFNLQETLDKILKDKKSDLESMLEKQIHDHVSLEKAIQKIWLDLQKPMPIYKKEPKVWFKFGFEKMYGSIRLVEPDLIICDVLMQAHTAVSLDSLRLPRTDSMLPRLQPYPQGIEDDFNLSVHASIPFEYANATVNQLLKGKKIEQKGYSVTIEQVTIYGTNKGIAVKVKTKGDIKGNLYLVGSPRYYDAEGKLRLDSFNYDINTQSMLLNAATEALREPLLDYLKPYLEVQVGQYLSLVPNLISRAIEKGKAGQTIELHIDSLSVWDHYGIVTRSDLQIVLRTKGQAKLEIQHLKSGDKLKIGKKKKPQRQPTQ